MTVFPIASPATAMKFFWVTLAAMAWTVIFLFLAVRFLFTAVIIAGLTIGLFALVYAMTALVRGTLRRVREASPMLTSSMLIGSITILIGVLGQLLSGWSGIKPFGGLAGLWLGLLVFGLVIQLYGQAAYLRNLA
jgi:hypothetical protein